jgi:diguanylate cyclase (GGDEF)-like protein
MIHGGNLLQMDLYRNLASQVLIDLKELEGDYRVFNFSVDKAQSIVTMIIAALCVFGMLHVDAMLFVNQAALLWWMVIYRGSFGLFTGVVSFLIFKAEKVRAFDRLLTVWIFATILFLLFFNFTRPADYLTTVFDIIVVFAIYVLSPLKLQTNMSLAVVFSACTLYIDHFMKTGVDPILLSAATSAQVVVQLLGLGSAVQMHSYRRRAFKTYIDEKDAREMVAYLANIDPLTKSLTRRHFFSIAESEFRRFTRYRRPLSVLVLDADRFKAINDLHGHHAGDLALRSLSLVAMEHKRTQDTFGRLGGEEFGLILPETNLEQARVVAERIRAMLEQTPVSMDGSLIQATVSIGVAEAGAGDETFDQLLRRADLLMYKAKDQGRNRVVTE